MQKVGLLGVSKIAIALSEIIDPLDNSTKYKLSQYSCVLFMNYDLIPLMFVFSPRVMLLSIINTANANHSK